MFALGISGKSLDKGWDRPLLVGLAAFDVLAEFVFHGAFRITVSVIVGVLLPLPVRVEVASANAEFPSGFRRRGSIEAAPSTRGRVVQ